MLSHSSDDVRSKTWADPDGIVLTCHGNVYEITHAPSLNTGSGQLFIEI